MTCHQGKVCKLLELGNRKVVFNKEYGVMRIWIYETNDDGKMKGYA